MLLFRAPMSHPIRLDKPGETILLMGNEAIVRGALESGVRVAASYPGTPASEIGNTFAEVAREAGIHFEWSTNEKVAFEVAYGASMCNQRAMVSMKHVGLNVALDIMEMAALRGVKGGLVFVSADDPSQHSSGQEQDQRWLAKQNCVPALEPCDPQDAKDFTVYAYELSERHRLPVMIRTVTRVSHMRSGVRLGKLLRLNREAMFDFDQFSYVKAGFDKLFYGGERAANEKIARIREEFESSPLNKLTMAGGEKVGVVAVGLTYNYVMDALVKLGAREKVAVLKLGTSNPIPERLVSTLLGGIDKVLVTEEPDPFVELHVKAIAKDSKPSVELHGRLDGSLPGEGELGPLLVDNAISKMLGIASEHDDRAELEADARNTIFSRTLTVCAGCPHRASIYALKRAVKAVRGDIHSLVVNGDIGCYGLAWAPPMSYEDTYFCMGASVGVSQGMSQVGVDSISWIGDGTFFHAAIPALMNAVQTRTNIKVVVADNGVTAMTGFQPNPQSGVTAMGDATKSVSIEAIARAVGVEHVEVVDAYDLKASQAAFERMLRSPGVAVVISRRLCATEAFRRVRPNRPVPFYVDEDRCVGCKLCLTTFGCPALRFDDDKGKGGIDPSLCTGCGVCAQVCASGCIVRGNTG
jgi:indolepyruvate ferredoxin oxidoreductase alpha subunit